MRTKQEIEEDNDEFNRIYSTESIILEVLLDIRELLIKQNEKTKHL